MDKPQCAELSSTAPRSGLDDSVRSVVFRGVLQFNLHAKVNLWWYDDFKILTWLVANSHILFHSLSGYSEYCTAV
jgi:hypothetical protein